MFEELNTNSATGNGCCTECYAKHFTVIKQNCNCPCHSPKHPVEKEQNKECCEKCKLGDRLVFKGEKLNCICPCHNPPEQEEKCGKDCPCKYKSKEQLYCEEEKCKHEWKDYNEIETKICGICGIEEKYDKTAWRKEEKCKQLFPKNEGDKSICNCCGRTYGEIKMDKFKEKWDMEKEFLQGWDEDEARIKANPIGAGYKPDKYKILSFIHLSNQKMIEQAIAEVNKIKNESEGTQDWFNGIRATRSVLETILNSLLK